MVFTRTYNKMHVQLLELSMMPLLFQSRRRNHHHHHHHDYHQIKVSGCQQMRAGQGNFKQFCDVADWFAWRHKHLSGVLSKLSLNGSYPTLDGFSVCMDC